MKNKIIKAAFYLFLAAFLWKNSFSYLDTDLGWHLRCGYDALVTKSVPHEQIYMWTLGSAHWVDHEWLINIAMYLINHHLGYWALTLFFISIILLAIYIIQKSLQRQFGHRSDVLFYVWTIIGVLGMRPHLGIRAQEISILGQTIIFWIILEPGRYEKAKKYLPLIFWLWSSMHAGFLFGLIALALYSLNQLWQMRQQSWRKLAAFSLWPILAFAATWLTPYGTELYSFLFQYRGGDLSHYLGEWRPLYAWPIAYAQLFGLSIALGGYLSIIIFDFNKKTFINFLKKNYFSTGLLLVLIIMSFSAIRHFPLFWSGASLIILPAILRSNEQNQLRKNIWPKWLPWFIIFILLLTSFDLWRKTHYTINPFQSSCQEYPCKSVNYIKEHPELLKLRWLNHYNIGGYLIGTLPEAKLYIDGRLPQFPRGDTTMLKDYLEFEDSTMLAAKLRKEKIELVIWIKSSQRKLSFFDKMLFPERPSLANTSAMYKYLEADKSWQKIFEDEATVIYTKKSTK